MKILKKVGSLVLIFCMLLNCFPASCLNVAHAGENIIKSIEVDKSTVHQSERVKVNVNFGGPGTRVTEGQEVKLTFNLDKTAIELPRQDIPLQNAQGVELGTVSFQNDTNEATIKFNKTASTLQDVEGGFYFYMKCYYTGDMNQNGQGSITIGSGDVQKVVQFVYEKGGTSTTDEVYSKSAVWFDGHPEGNRLDWVFTVNAAHKATNGAGYNVVIEDDLPDTMEWDMERNNTYPHIVTVNFGGGLRKTYSIEKAKAAGFTIEIQGQHLKIVIPRVINDEDYGWIDPLDNRAVSIRFTAKVKDAVMANPAIEYVENSSTVQFNGLDWQVKPENTHSKEKIIRQGGWASGTKPGELKITKVTQDKKIPIKGVEFTLERADGGDILVRQEDGSQLNVGPQKTITTNAQGIADIKGLLPAAYKVKETHAPEWIAFDIDQPIVKEFTVGKDDPVGKEFVIDNQKKQIEINVTKEWQDGAGHALNDAPASVQVQLYRNDEKVEPPVTLSQGALQYSWKNLDYADDQGNTYNYSVKELDENGNEVTDNITLNGKNYTVDVKGSAEKGFTIVNKEMPKISFDVTKAWQDDNNKDGKRPPQVVIQLMANDQVVPDKTITLDEGNQWTAQFTNLEQFKDGQPIKYGVKEVAVENGYTSEVTGNVDQGFTVTNKRNSEKVDIHVKKVWNDHNDQDGKRPEEISFKLLKNDREFKTIKLTKNENWETTIAGLDKYENGHLITYKILEENVSAGYTSKVTGSVDQGFTITNTKAPEKISIEGKKTWNDHNNQDGKRPQTITINLLKNGQQIDSKIVNEGENWSWNFVGLDKYENGKEITYTISEDVVDGYTPKIEKYNVTNTYTPGKTSVQVVKVWDDDNNKEGKRPEKITIKLLADDQEVAGKTLTLNQGNNWTGQFNDLDQYKNGKEIKYTVKEDGEEKGAIQLNGKKYDVSYKGGMKEGFTITNKVNNPWTPPHWVPSKPTIKEAKVAKVWQDANGNKLQAPVDKIVVELYKDGVSTGKKLELNKDNGWTGKFDKLSVASNSSADIRRYTIKEVGEHNGLIQLGEKKFAVHYDGNVKDGFTVTNKEQKTPLPETREIKVSKAWKDASGHNLKAPVDKMTVELYKDGVATGKKLELNAANNWSGVFKDLEVAKQPEGTTSYQYTVKEVGENKNTVKLDGKLFEVSYSGNMSEGFVITNKYKDSQKPTPKPTPGTPNKNLPKTGDPHDPFLYSLAVGLLGVGMVVAGKRKRRK